MAQYIGDSRVLSLVPFPGPARNPIAGILDVPVYVGRQPQGWLEDGTPVYGQPFICVVGQDVAEALPEMVVGRVQMTSPDQQSVLDAYQIDDGALPYVLLLAFQRAAAALAAGEVTAETIGAALLQATGQASNAVARTDALAVAVGVDLDDPQPAPTPDERITALEADVALLTIGLEDVLAAASGLAEAVSLQASMISIQSSRIAELVADAEALSAALAGKVSFQDFSIATDRLAEVMSWSWGASNPSSATAESAEGRLALLNGLPPGVPIMTRLQALQLALGTHAHSVGDLVDGDGLATDDEVSAAIQAATGGNRPPMPGTSSVIVSGLHISGTASATDPDGDPLTYTWVVSQNGAPVTSAPGAMFEFTVSSAGTYQVSCSVADGRGASVVLLSTTVDCVAPVDFSGTWTMTRSAAFSSSVKPAPGSVDTLVIAPTGVCSSPDALFWMGSIAPLGAFSARFTSARTGVSCDFLMQPDGSMRCTSTSGPGVYTAVRAAA